MKLKTMSIRRKAVLLTTAAFVLMGASAPSACTPKPVSLQPVVGFLTTGGSRAPDPGATCPLIQDPGGFQYPGEPGKFGVRVAAKDPKEWLSLHLCYRPPSGFLYEPREVHSGTFTVYTTSGNLKGAVTFGELGNSGLPRSFRFNMKITSGTGSYKGATGTLMSAGCMTSTEQLIDGWLNTTNQGQAPGCKVPSLKPLTGAASSGSGWADPEDPTECSAPARYRFAQTIVAADPKEYLSIHACEKHQAGPDPLDYMDGTFGLYTATGRVKGNVQGRAYAEVGREFTNFEFILNVTSGNGAYANAIGPMFYIGCLEANGKLRAGELFVGDTGPEDGLAACQNP